MIIDMYRDTASHYGLCKDDGVQDNIVQLDVPKDSLLNYYEWIQMSDDYYRDIEFEDWIQNYTCDDMEDLLQDIITQVGNLDDVKVMEETI